MNHACKKYLVGRALGRLFCAFLIDSPLGVNTKWLSTSVNVIANDISRIKKDSPDSNFDYFSLQIKYPQLRDCRLFQPSVELLSMIWCVMLTKNLPDPKVFGRLKCKGLGKLTTWSSVGSTRCLILVGWGQVISFWLSCMLTL